MHCRSAWIYWVLFNLRVFVFGWSNSAMEVQQFAPIFISLGRWHHAQSCSTGLWNRYPCWVSAWADWVFVEREKCVVNRAMDKLAGAMHHWRAIDVGGDRQWNLCLETSPTPSMILPANRQDTSSMILYHTFIDDELLNALTGQMVLCSNPAGSAWLFTGLWEGPSSFGFQEFVDHSHCSPQPQHASPRFIRDDVRIQFCHWGKEGNFCVPWILGMNPSPIDLESPFTRLPTPQDLVVLGRACVYGYHAWKTVVGLGQAQLKNQPKPF